ncbi:hypothetical protein DRW03_34320 [Corallococcus sp. H22C18031201]|nr:hypothetical protein DRW03_34320 [Corallococcus sp. H22C18031201]
MSAQDRDALTRWRLVLGPEAEKTGLIPSLESLAPSGVSLGLDSEEQLPLLDGMLSYVYGPRTGDLSNSQPYMPDWLAAMRRFFQGETLALVQQEVIARRGLAPLLQDPESLPLLEPNLELVKAILASRDLVPDEAKARARAIVRDVVTALRKQLEATMRTTVLGALRRANTSPAPLARNLDWKRTLRANLKGWDAKHQRLVPERIYFWPNQRQRHEWDVTLVVDQSGSMAESVVYSAVMAAIFASLNALNTSLVLFDTQVLDMTRHLTDPLEVLFSTQLGGGTDIHQAVAYAHENHVRRPEKTLFLLISDLCEGGDEEALVARMRQLVESRARVVCLLALSDAGAPAYNTDMARRLTALGIPCFGCPPRKLAEVMDRVLRNQDLTPLMASIESGVTLG